MTAHEALDTTKKIFDASIKSGMIQTVDDAKTLYDTYKFLLDALTMPKEVVPLKTKTT